MVKSDLQRVFLLSFSTLVCSCEGFEEAKPDLELTNIVFPEDAGVIDVTKAPYFADPAPGNDDTVAIQTALNDNVGGLRVLYFPEGTYDVSPQAPDARAALLFQGQFGGNILQGQNKKAVIRLHDSVPEAYSGAVIRTVRGAGRGSADVFFNSIRNLTVSVGTAHPVASGIQFWSNNQGTVRDVDIISEDADKVGRVGLDMGFSDNIGPLLVKNVKIVGFDMGLRTQFQTSSQTIEDLTLLDQRVVGWQNARSQTVFANRVISENAVTAISNESQARLLLLQSRLSGRDGAAELAALSTSRDLYLRQVEVDGYADGLVRRNAPGQEFRFNPALPTQCVEEYWYEGISTFQRGGMLSLFDSPQRGLNLPVEDPPEVPWEQDFSKWAGPHQFAEGDSGFAGDGKDDTAALQRAIDSGATTIYLPNGKWNIEGTVVLRKNVRRLMGTHAVLDGPGTIRIADGESPTVLVERFNKTLGAVPGVTFEHASSRTLVIRHYSGLQYSSLPEGSGRLFLEDVVMRPPVFRNQKVWGRQVNIEADTQDLPEYEAKLVNDGGTVWILGFKTERRGTVVKTKSGGKTEVLGSYHNGPGQSNPDNPQISVEESHFFGAMFTSATSAGGWDVFARQVVAGEVRELATSAGADAFSLYGRELIEEKDIVMDNSDPSGVELIGDWTATSEFDGGFLGRDFVFAAPDSGSTALYTPKIQKAGMYSVFVRGKNHRGGQPSNPRATEAPLVLTHGEGTTDLQVNQRVFEGGWIKLGDFSFDADDTASLLFETAAANGNVSADGVRFLRDGGRVPLQEALASRGWVMRALPEPGLPPGTDQSRPFLSFAGELSSEGQKKYLVWRIQNPSDERKSLVLRGQAGLFLKPLQIETRSEVFVRTPVLSEHFYFQLFEGNELIDTRIPSSELKFQNMDLVSQGCTL